MIFLKSDTAINDSQQNADNIPNVESDEMNRFKRKWGNFKLDSISTKGWKRFFLQLVMLTGNRSLI